MHTCHQTTYTLRIHSRTRAHQLSSKIESMTEPNLGCTIHKIKHCCFKSVYTWTREYFPSPSPRPRTKRVVWGDEGHELNTFPLHLHALAPNVLFEVMRGMNCTFAPVQKELTSSTWQRFGTTYPLKTLRILKKCQKTEANLFLRGGIQFKPMEQMMNQKREWIYKVVPYSSFWRRRICFPE